MRLSDAAWADSIVRDRQIVERIVRGDTTAVAELYDQYGRLAFSVAVSIVGDSAAAEDIVQDVFVRVWRSANTYRPDGASVRAWLLAIAHHRAVDEWRRRRKERGSVSLDEAGQNEWAATDDNLADPLVSRAVGALPAEQRQVIELAYFHGLTMVEIADRLNVAPGTVKSRIRLALEKLRAKFGVEHVSAR
jgi:RNA polymerase sigma-70 factor (ECF subfamily)